MNFVNGMDGEDFFRVLLEICQRHWGDEFLVLGIGAHPAENLITIRFGLRDVLLRLPDTAVQAGDGRWKCNGADGGCGHAGKRNDGVQNDECAALTV